MFSWKGTSEATYFYHPRRLSVKHGHSIEMGQGRTTELGSDFFEATSRFFAPEVI